MILYRGISAAPKMQKRSARRSAKIALLITSGTKSGYANIRLLIDSGIKSGYANLVLLTTNAIKGDAFNTI